jgi:hypothetical protein
VGLADWTFLNNSLDKAAVNRGATAGITPPPGGGNFVYAFNSTALVNGGTGLFCNLDDFAPMAKGGSIRGCVQRGPSGGATGFSPFIFLGCQGDSVNDRAYMLGLSDEDPYRIVLRKGTISVGIPDSEGEGVLLASGQSFNQAVWLHIRLDMIVNMNGDVVLRVFSNDLSSRPLGEPPSWVEIQGMGNYLDDATGINSGSAPLLSGRSGFAFAVKDVTRRGFFDHIEVARQL